RASPAVQAYMRLVTRAARNATMILTVSDYSKQDIIEVLDLPEDRVRVIREAPSMQYRRVTDPNLLARTRMMYGLGERFIMTTGIDQRKNVAGLVGAFAAVFHELNDPEMQLFIVGDPKRLGTSPLFPDWRPLAATFGVADQVVCASVDEADLPVLYSAATCFAFASLYEGFGLTPLEAMACGAPVVCSDRTSLPEVVGTAGILVNPEDPDRLGAALQRVLTTPQLQDDLRARGLARVKQYSWDQAAVETSTLYAEVTGTKRE
ncbi:MAG: glycosyltransferase family 4 protein, partial [Ktedonobacterales bacterium]